LASAPRYVGTKTGAVVKAIVIDSHHTWRDIRRATGLSEKELNYQLHLLFNDNVIFKDKNEYYIIPELEEQYLAHFRSLPLQTVDPSSTQVNNNSTKVVKQFSLFNIKGIIIIAVLLLSLSLNITNYTNIAQLETQIEAQSQTMQRYVSTIEELENNIEQLNSQIDSLVTLNEALSEYTLSLEAQISELKSESTSSSSSSSFQNTSTRTILIDLIGTCTRVIDGDTFELSSGKRIRLADIDAPESYESGYTTSTNALSSWILSETVYLDIDDIFETDIYGRYVCVVYVEYGTGYANVNNVLLTNGYAELSDYYNEFDPSVWGTPGNLDTSEAIQDTSSSSSSSSSSDSSTSSGRYVGSINSNKYHYPSCYWAQQINLSNEIWFTSKADAEAHGYVPCKVCKP